MSKQPIYERVYSPLDPDKDFAKVQARIRAEIDELKSVGDGICYHDPDHGGRLVREYPDGHKMFIVEGKDGALRETEIPGCAKAA
jgi:hypothetical protein